MSRAMIGSGTHGADKYKRCPARRSAVMLNFAYEEGKSDGSDTIGTAPDSMSERV